RLPDQDRVVLLAPAEHLHHPLDLLGPTDRRVELAGTGQLGQITAEVVQGGGLALLFALRCRAAPATGAAGTRGGRRDVAAQEAQRLGACLLERDAEGV